MGAVDRIPIGDFPLGKEEWKAVKRVFDSGRITEGREVRAFEDEFADYMGVRHCVATSSGTAALMVGLRALGVSKQFPFTVGARVLVPALTFIATANAVELAGFRIMFGDISPETMCLDPAEIARTRTEIVLPVHLMGFGADMKAIVAECTKHQRYLVEDAAEAHGTTIDGKLAGTFGVWGAFSFYPAHTVQAGELGCIVTNSLEVAQVARQLRAHGRECQCRICTRNTTGCPQIQAGGADPRFRAQYKGWNYKPMEFQAALARVQLGRIEENIIERRCVRARLEFALRGLNDVFVEPIPSQPMSVPMAFPIILKRAGYRDRVVAELERRGVEARPLFGCIPTQQPSFAGTEDAPRMKLIYQERGLPVAEHYGADGFYVGCHQYLTAEQVDRMAQTIIDVITEVVT